MSTEQVGAPAPPAAGDPPCPAAAFLSIFQPGVTICESEALPDGRASLMRKGAIVGLIAGNATFYFGENNAGTIDTIMVSPGDYARLAAALAEGGA